METVTPHFLLNNWQRKLIAILGAIAIWFAVNQTITSTKTLGNVPIRLINLSPNRTVDGLLPNGILSKRLMLTVTGTKDVVDRLESSDVEVVVDAADLANEATLQISKKNLMSLNPDIDLAHHLTGVSSNEFAIKFSRLITERIPIMIGPPTGGAPEPYQFLDIWPQQLYQTVTGPEDQVHRLQEKGLILTFDLNKISKAELDAIQGSADAFRGDEVSFPVPAAWRKVEIPFAQDEEEAINDPLGKDLVISFLRKELIPLGVDVPVRVYYPVTFGAAINPQSHPLELGGWLTEKNHISQTQLPLFASEVSRWFIDVIRNHIEITIVAAPRNVRDPLQWGVEIADLQDLENNFVEFLMTDREHALRSSLGDLKKRETRLRRRFRDYVQKLKLYKEQGKALELDCRLQDNGITAREVSLTD